MKVPGRYQVAAPTKTRTPTGTVRKILIAIHEPLPGIPKRELRLIGWTKARELVKVARRERQDLDSAPWVHKAHELPKEEFKGEVDRHVTRKETEPW
jgi:hypothetical protein